MRLVFVCLSSLAIAMLAASVARAETLALLPLGGAADPPARLAVETELRPLLDGRAGFRVQSAQETADAVAAAEALGESCKLAESACMDRTAAIAAVDAVVGGRVDNDAAGVRVSLSLVVPGKGVVRETSVVVPRGGPGRAQALLRVAVRLLEPSAERGTLEILTERGAGVLIDGKLQGDAPLGPIAVSPGVRRVEVVAPGYETAEREVDVQIGARLRLEIPLRRAHDPPPVIKEPLKEPDEPLDLKRLLPPPHVARNVAVFGFENIDDDPAVVAWFAQALAVEIAKREGVLVLDRLSARGILGDAMGPQLEAAIDACKGEGECVLALAEESRVDVVVWGSVRRTATGRELTLNATSVGTGGPRPYAYEKVIRGGARRALAEHVGAAVFDLLPDHTVRADARAGVSPVLLHALDPPPLPAPVFVSAAGLAGAALLTTGGLGAVWAFAGVRSADTRAAIGLGALGGLGFAVGVGALSFVMLPFVDWGPPEAPAP